MPTCQWSSSSGMCWASMSRRSSRRGQVRVVAGSDGQREGTSLAIGSLPAHQWQSMATTGTLSSLLPPPATASGARRIIHWQIKHVYSVGTTARHPANRRVKAWVYLRDLQEQYGLTGGGWGRDGGGGRQGGREGGWVGGCNAGQVCSCVPVLHGLAVPNAAAGGQPLRAVHPPPTAPSPADAALQHIAAVCGQRYNPNKGLLKLTSDRYEHREANRAHIRKVGHCTTARIIALCRGAAVRYGAIGAIGATSALQSLLPAVAEPDTAEDIQPACHPFEPLLARCSHHSAADHR